MFIRVNFHDNDFATVVMDACEAIMHEISRGYKGEEAISRYEKSKKDYGLEAIRKSIVLSAYGYYIATKGTRSYYVNQEKMYDVAKYESTLAYLDKEISIEEIENFVDEWENSEVCYIDFYAKKVYLQ